MKSGTILFLLCLISDSFIRAQNFVWAKSMGGNGNDIVVHNFLIKF